MRVFICVPTYNEEENIQSITKIVDQGLGELAARYPQVKDCKIVLADSASSDKTVALFLACETEHEKMTLLQKQRGKGVNLLSFMRYALKEKADYCMTIDADIVSASASWIQTMLGPIIEDMADYVTPLYRRSRFEGSTTVHFAYPTIFGFTGRHIRQPIGGDFAFGQNFMKVCVKQSVPESALAYGIDIFMTMAACSAGLRVIQTALEQKIHAPSFPKLEGMFPQVAATAAFLSRGRDIAEVAGALPELPVGIISNSQPTDASKVLAMKKRVSEMLAKGETYSWLPDSVEHARGELASGDLSARIDQQQWVEVLAAWYKQVMEPGADCEGMARQLLPFFMLRAITFWKDVASLPAEAVEAAATAQAQAFREELLKVLGKVSVTA